MSASFPSIPPIEPEPESSGIDPLDSSILPFPPSHSLAPITSQNANQIILPASPLQDLTQVLQGLYEVNQSLAERLHQPPPRNPSFFLYFLLLLTIFISVCIAGYHYIFRELFFQQETNKLEVEKALRDGFSRFETQKINTFSEDDRSQKNLEESYKLLKGALKGTQDELERAHQLQKDFQERMIDKEKKLEEKEEKIAELHQVQQKLTQEFTKQFAEKEKEIQSLKEQHKQFEEQLEQLVSLGNRQKEEIQKLKKQIPQLSPEDLKRLRALDEEFDGEFKKHQK